MAILGVPDWGWFLALIVYISILIFYHLKEKLFPPYIGKRRFLVFCDLFIISFFRNAIIHTPLLYLQLILVIVADIYSFPKRQTRNTKFWAFYWIAIFASFFLVHFQIKTSIYFALAKTCYLFTIAIAISLLLRFFAEQIVELEKLPLLQEENKQNEIAEAHYKWSKRSVQCQQAILQQAIFQQELIQALLRVPLPGHFEWYHKFHQAIQENLRTLSLISYITSQHEASHVQVKKLTEKISIQNFLQETIEKAVLFQQAKSILDGEEKEENDSKLHLMNKIPEQISISGCVFWRWIIYCWIKYLCQFTGKSELEIIFSENPNNYTIKGISSLAVSESDYRMEGMKCPTCDKQVRHLYNIPFIAITACRDCLKANVELKLKRDWENPIKHEKSHENPLWLPQHLLFRYKLGSVHHGIQHWEHWKYFVTLIVEKNI